MNQGTDRRERRFLFAAVLTTVTMVAEAIGGVVSGSLALLADAGHMLVDSSALLLAWLGARFARRPPDARRSFGYGRLEVLAGFVNALTLFVLVAWIVWEAIERMRDPSPILSGVMLSVALAGLVVNLLVLAVLGGHGHHGHGHGNAHGHEHTHANGGDRRHERHPLHSHAHEHGDEHKHDQSQGHSFEHEHGHDHGHSHEHPDGRRHETPNSGVRERLHSADRGPAAGHTHGHIDEDVNLQGARLHVIGDLLGSLAAVAAALIVRYTGWTPIDPILSVFVALLILISATRLLRRTSHILLEGVPTGLDLNALARTLSTVHPAITDVHHLHVWTLGGGRRLATLHLRVNDNEQSSAAQAAVRSRLLETHGIDHVTIQVDTDETSVGTCRFP